MPDPAPLIIAVVLNWNLIDDTLKAVDSLHKSDTPNLKIVVVDNGSRPEVVSAIDAQLPNGVTHLKLPENLGFAAGNNAGTEWAMHQGADFVLLINNDTIVDPSMLTTMLHAAEQHPHLGLLGPMIYYLAEPERVWFAGYNMPHGIYILRRGLHLKTPLKPVEEVDFVSGCALLIRRNVIEQIGGLSEDYFMYYEDLDYCLRAKAAGVGVGCVTGAKMWHAISTSSGGLHSPTKQYYIIKSSLVFYRRHSHGLRYVLNLSLTFLRAGYSFMVALLQGRLTLSVIRLFLQGMREGFSRPRPSA